jgi:hypothetical protein
MNFISNIDNKNIYKKIFLFLEGRGGERAIFYFYPTVL